MIGMNVCPLHSCYLMNSIIVTHSKAPPMLRTAEGVIPMYEVIRTSENDMELQVAQYMAEVFQREVDLNLDVSVGRFLHAEMEHTPYCSTRGEQRNIALFHKDFLEHYSFLPGNWLTELWQLQKVLTDDRTNFYEVCLLALFLKIPADALVDSTLPEKTKQQLFDEEIHRLHEQGMNYVEIAKRLDASYNVVKAIGEGRYKKRIQ